MMNDNEVSVLDFFRDIEAKSKSNAKVVERSIF